MRRVATAPKTPVVVPVVVIAVDVHVALVVPLVEGRDYVMGHPHHCPSNRLRAESNSASQMP